jgi:hypothetical protein
MAGSLNSTAWLGSAYLLHLLCLLLPHGSTPCIRTYRSAHLHGSISPAAASGSGGKAWSRRSIGKGSSEPSRLCQILPVFPKFRNRAPGLIVEKGDFLHSI